MTRNQSVSTTMAVKQLARIILILLANVVFAMSLSLRDVGTAYSSEDQTALLNAHNDYRSQVSPTATNMDEMIWDADLAKQAQDWANTCVYEHPDMEIQTDYVGIGQNLYTVYNIHGYDTPKPEVTAAVTSWYDEEKDYSYGTNTCASGKVCGHYTQVVWADTTAVGCGIKYCSSLKRDGQDYLPDAWIVVCNYEPGGNRGVYQDDGEVVWLHPYNTGDQCSECPDGKPCKNGLCSDCTPNGVDCECSIKCQNCGTMATKDGKCECTCPDGYFGPLCEEYCEDTHKYCNASPGWPTRWCNDANRPYVDQYCPVMCSLCTPGSKVDPNNCS